MKRTFGTAAMKSVSGAQLIVSLFLMAAGCASAPPAVQPQPMMAADNGQPKMHAALQALGQARAATEAASPNKGGHRELAIQLINQAIQSVNAGIRFANQHPTEIGVAEPPAAPEPVNEVVPGAERQPHMAQAMVELREAFRQLKEAAHDKGGHRQQGLVFIQQAMIQLREGINFANAH